MDDVLANDGPKGLELEQDKNKTILRKWQGFLRISIDDKKKKEHEIRRGKELYQKKREGLEGAANVRENSICNRPPNHAKNGIDIVVDQVYQRNPKVAAKARVPVYIDVPDPVTGMVTKIDVSDQRTAIIEEVVNHEMNESSLKQEAKACIRSAHIAPESWMETGYQFDEDNQIDAVYFRYRSVDDVFADPNMKVYEGVVRRCRFIAVRWRMTEDEAKAVRLDVKVLRSNSCNRSVDSETELFEVFHMWDRTTMLHGYFTESGAALPMTPEPWPWPIDGFPLEILRYSENPDERWSLAPIMEVESIQDEMNEQRETMNRHIVNSRPVKLFDTSLDDEKVNQIAGRDKGSWIGVKGLNERPNQIKIFNDDELGNEFYMHYERNRQQMAEILRYQPADLLQTTGATATESQNVATKAANQIGTKIDITEDFLRRIIKKAKKIIEATYITDRMTEISGKDGQKFWVRWSGGILNDTDVDIEVGSTEKEDSEKRLQVALNMLGTMLQVPGLNIIELALDVLRKSDYRDVDKYKLSQMQPPQAAPGGQPSGTSQNPNVTPEGISGQTSPMV